MSFRALTLGIALKGIFVISEFAAASSFELPKPESVSTEVVQGHNVHCQIESQPVIFVTVRETPGISLKKATLDDGATLIWSYNIFYDIGGAVILVDQIGNRVSLLTWDNAFEDDVLIASVYHNNANIQCEVVQGS